MSEFAHETVLLHETVTAIAPNASGIYVDATLGGAGHARAILEASSPDGQLIGIDRDPRALAAARERLAEFGSRVRLVHGTFGEIRRVLEEAGIAQVQGVVADLGVSSPQFDEAERGFSFSKPGPLDMRMDPTSGESLRELLERVDATELADILYTFGEERKSRPIARAIKLALERGELETTEDLRRATVKVLGPKRSGIDPATRTFQALRIAVNRELDELASLLSALPKVLAPGGRAALISFHSGEDRMVKHAFRDDAALTALTKRPIEASQEERDRNPRSRSAKLRAAERRVVEESP